MDYEEKRKLQKRSVVIAEFFMVFAVVAIVTLTVLITMGFNVNHKGEVEQSGLMQLHSMPTGATVSIDGETLFTGTNTSRSLSPGEHWLELSREGYDHWEKAIKMHPGHLMRLYYPRLFLQNRSSKEIEKVDLAKATFYQTSRGRNYLLYGNNSGEWQLVDIKGDEVVNTKIDVKSVFTDKDEEIEIIPEQFTWSKDENRVLVRAKVNGERTWAVINFKTIKESMNLTKKFNLDFSDIKLATNSAMRLWAFENGNIHILDVGGASLSTVLVNNVADFAVYDEDLIYVTGEREGGKRAIGYYQDGAKSSLVVKEIDDLSQPVKLAISHYYDANYLVYTIGNHAWVWGGEFSKLAGLITEKERTIDIEGENSVMRKFTDADMGIIPDRLVLNNGGEYVVGNTGKQFVAVDIDMGDTYSYDRPVDQIKWIDDDMLYGIVDGKLSVWDFDGWNTRELASDVDNQPVIISKNDLYVYYVSGGKLMRMRIID